MIFFPIKMPKTSGSFKWFCTLVHIIYPLHALPPPQEWVPCRGILNGHLDKDSSSIANPLGFPWAALDTLRWIFMDSTQVLLFSSCRLYQQTTGHPGILLLFSIYPAMPYFPEKTHVTTRLNLWRKTFSFLVAFLGCLEPDLLNRCDRFYLRCRQQHSETLTLTSSKAKTIRAKFEQSVYLRENVTPLGFFHFYQTSIDIVVIFLMKFNPTMVNWKANQNSEVNPGGPKCPHRQCAPWGKAKKVSWWH